MDEPSNVRSCGVEVQVAYLEPLQLYLDYNEDGQVCKLENCMRKKAFLLSEWMMKGDSTLQC